MSLKRSSNDLFLAETLLSWREERVEGKYVNKNTANNKFSEEKTNIDDLIKSSPVGRFSRIQTTQNVAVQQKAA